MGTAVGFWTSLEAHSWNVTLGVWLCAFSGATGVNHPKPDDNAQSGPQKVDILHLFPVLV